MDAENGVTGMLENREVKFLGAAGGPVLVPGFSSDSISVATFQEQCVCLLQELDVELKQSELHFFQVDTNVDDLKLLNLEKVLIQAEAELWPNDNQNTNADSRSAPQLALESTTNFTTVGSRSQDERRNTGPTGTGQVQLSPIQEEMRGPESTSENLSNNIEIQRVEQMLMEDIETTDIGNRVESTEDVPHSQQEMLQTVDQNLNLDELMDIDIDFLGSSGPGVEENNNNGQNENQEDQIVENGTNSSLVPTAGTSQPENDVTEKESFVFKRGRKSDVEKEEERKRKAVGAEKERFEKMERYLELAKERELLWKNSKLKCVKEEKDLEAKQKSQNFTLTKECSFAKRLPNFVFASVETGLVVREPGAPPLEENEVLLVVQFLDPMQKETKAQEFVMRANQKLTALRDAIYCTHDIITERVDMSVPSAFFCIEDVFYNDMRSTGAVDQSAEILAWNKSIIEFNLATQASHKQKPNGPIFEAPPPEYKSARMEDVCFSDFQFRIGVQYLYFHQDGCRHLFLITDVRLSHPQDPKDGSFYPLVTFQQPVKYRKCTVCGVKLAQKVVHGSRMMVESPSFLCEECYFSAHYSQDGNLLFSDFRVYDYIHE